jgi:hypothetical protein
VKRVPQLYAEGIAKNNDDNAVDEQNAQKPYADDESPPK